MNSKRLQSQQVVSYRAARVRWWNGQPLLPEHFYAQEESLREEIALRFSMHGAPFWGAGRLRWDEELLSVEGKLKLDSLTLFFESSSSVVSFGAEDLPSNALAPEEAFDLGATGTSEVVVYLHQDSASAEIHTGAGSANEESIRRVIYRLHLDMADTTPVGPLPFEVGRFKLGADAVWRLAPDSLPASVTVLNSAYETHVLPRFERVVGRLAMKVQNDLDTAILAGSVQAAAKIVQKGSFELAALQRQIAQGSLNPHPFELFKAIQSTYFELSALDNSAPDPIDYLHHAPGKSFGQLLDAVDRLLGHEQKHLPHLSFTKSAGIWSCRLEQQMKKAGRAFLLLKKPSTAHSLDLRKLKLSSADRLAHVHSHALRGVPFELIENPPFSHLFASTIEFYSLSPGNEWDYAVDEGALSFYDSENLRGVEAFLYYRES